MHSRLDKIGGKFFVKHFDKLGKLLGTYNITNGIPDAAKDTLLNIMFYTTAKISNWYIGLINGSGYTGVADGDTAASHSGWTEFTSFTGDRQAWTTGASSSETITSASAASFPITAGGTLQGIFVQSTSTKSSTSGTLWSTALFAAALSVNNGDTLQISYSVAA